MKNLHILLLILMPFLSQAQIISDFEDFGLSVGEYLNNADNAGISDGFEAEGIILPNYFSVFWGFESWEGWAISADNDVTTPGFMNQFSAITGAGYDNSTTYAVSYALNPSWIRIANADFGTRPSGMYITNNTYAYLSMQNGDAYSKKFGGATGDDPDFFKITVRAKKNEDFLPDSVEFYLADFRFSDNSQDYILDEWQWLDLTVFSAADSLMFKLSSSDNNSFGMATPAYFCADNISVMDFVNQNEVYANTLEFEVFPNPSSTYIQFNMEMDKAFDVRVFANNGQMVLNKKLNQSNARLYIDELPKGSYTVSLTDGEKIGTSVFVKE